MDERYKKRGLKFNNNLDSRALRAVHNQQRQREKRDDVLKTRRQIADIQDSPQVADLPKKKRAADRQAELYQKGLERYQNLLKWKEMKKKQLEKEKKRRMPSFKTGLYHPSPPKFLVSENQHESNKTPHASLKKKTMTPGASLRKVPVFHLGGTPATSLLRVPQFHTGLTPKASAKNQASMVLKQDKPENCGPFHRPHGAFKNGMRPGGKRGAARGCPTRSRILGEQEDLGVKPLPLTPPVTSQRNAEKSILPLQTLPSFAPADFAFNFEAPQTSGAKRIEHLTNGCIDDPISSHAQEASIDPSDPMKEDMAISKKELPMKEKPSVLQKADDGNISVTGDNEAQSVYKNDLFPQNDNTICTSHTIENEELPPKDPIDQDTSRTSENEVQPDPVTLSDELPEDSKHQEKSEPGKNLEMLSDEKIDEEPAVCEENFRYDQVKPEDERSNLSGMNTSAVEALEEDDPRPKTKRLSTPAKRVTRRSAACCLDGTVTPLLSRLRPRTPCSRSTRRSLSAHCDMPHELCTPSRRSTKKTPRRSVSKSVKRQVLYEAEIASPFPVPLDGEINDTERLAHGNEDRMMDAESTSEPQPLPQLTPSISLNAPTMKESSSPLMTPENIFRREQGMWTVETSPWVNLQRSKKKKIRVSDLHGAFDDIPVDGSPVPQPVIPSYSKTSLGEGTTCTNLLSLLQPSDLQNTESPEVNVWNEESPAVSALGSPKSSRQKQSSEKGVPPRVMDQEPKEVQTAYADVSALSTIESTASEPSSPSPHILSAVQNGKNKEKLQKRKSRKSVMFAVTEEEDGKDDYNILPVTPFRRSARVSMGIFAKSDPRVNETVIPGQDLIAFDSPINEKNAPSGTSRRKSCRVSLLPGMTLSPAEEEAGPIPTDLMTWDSPCEVKRPARHAVPSRPTPVRRSRRLSKTM